MRYEFIGKALWFPAEKILVISDLHIGYEEALNQKGFLVPRRQFGEIINDLEKILLSLGKRNRTQKLNEIIILGDLKHVFGSVSKQEWKDTLAVLDFLRERSRKIVLIRGNHDKILGLIAEQRHIEIRDFYIIHDICFIHGDKNFLSGKETKHIELRKIKSLVVGHRHPAVVVSNKYKREMYKCFLVGRWRRKDIIILPSFFPLIEGADIVNQKSNLMFIPESRLRDFSVYAVSGLEVFKFGKLKNIGELDS